MLALRDLACAVSHSVLRAGPASLSAATRGRCGRSTSVLRSRGPHERVGPRPRRISRDVVSLNFQKSSVGLGARPAYVLSSSTPRHAATSAVCEKKLFPSKWSPRCVGRDSRSSRGEFRTLSQVRVSRWVWIGEREREREKEREKNRRERGRFGKRDPFATTTRGLSTPNCPTGGSTRPPRSRARPRAALFKFYRVVLDECLGFGRWNVF